MRIAFDHQVFLMQAYGGISRYVVRLAQELISNDIECRIFAPLHRNQYLRDLPGQNVEGWMFEKFPPKSNRLFSALNRSLCKHAVKHYSPSVLHETYYNRHPVASHGAARILTVHDMIHERCAPSFSTRDKTSAHKFAAVERADHIICISHSTKRDLCEIFNVLPEKISVIHHGFEKLPIAKAPAKTVFNDKPFLLFVGNRRGYKNFESLLRAVASRHELLSNFDIFAFGGGAFNVAEARLIHSLGFREGTVQHYSGSDAVLGMLYEHASAFILPSLYEGFGLPPLEAMAHDCPVVSSNSSAMPEVIGEAGEYFTPSNIDDQAQAICNVVFDTSRRNKLVQLGRERLEKFSWRRCADETLQVYQKAS